MKKTLLVFLLSGGFALSGLAAPQEDDPIQKLLLEKGWVTAPTPESAASGPRGTGLEGLVMHALGFLGVPYQRGGNSFITGVDCSGFVKAIFAQTLGMELPRSAHEQAEWATSIRRNELSPGDLVFFNTLKRAYSHVGIYIGEGKFIHSPRSGATVRIDDMGANYWRSRFNGARRIPAEQTAAYQSPQAFEPAAFKPSEQRQP